MSRCQFFLICKFYVIPIKIPTSYVIDMDKPTLTFKWKDKRPKNSQNDIEDKTRWLTDNTILKNYYKAIVIKTV